MARGVNKVILIGNLGKDPVIRSLPNDTRVATLSLATSLTWRDPVSGQPQERTEWHRVVLYGRLGDIAGNIYAKAPRSMLKAP